MSQPNIQRIPISELVTDSVIELSGRTKAERAKNAALLVPSLSKGWDEGQPGQVFWRDEKWHVAAGFTRVYAIRELLKDKEAVGYFVAIPDDPARLRTVAIRTNSGKDISNIAKGKIFIQMRDGDDPTKLTAGQVGMAPMTLAQIGEEVGLSPQGVIYCIHIAEAPDEIREMLEADPPQVNGNVVDCARRMATDKKTKELNEKLYIKAVKAAYAHAKANGKKAASQPDFDAIKGEVFPLKAAVDPKKPVVKAKNQGPIGAGSEGTDEETEPKEAKGGAGDTPALELGEESKPEPKSSDYRKRERANHIEQLKTLLLAADESYERKKENKDDDGLGIGLAEEEIEHLAQSLVDAGATVPLSPI